MCHTGFSIRSTASVSSDAPALRRSTASRSNRAAARTGFKKDFRIFFQSGAGKGRRRPNIAMRHSALIIGARHPARSLGQATVHVPFDLGDMAPQKTRSNRWKEIQPLFGEIQDILGLSPVRSCGGLEHREHPVGVGNVEVAVVGRYLRSNSKVQNFDFTAPADLA